MRSQQTPDLFATLDAAAAGAHEIFMSYVRAGFSRQEALKLLTNQLRIAHECPKHTEEE